MAVANIIPTPHVPVVDPSSGLVDPDWYGYLQRLQGGGGGGGGSFGGTFATVALLAGASIDGGTDVVVTLGYYAAGDGGGAMYKRVSPQPLHSMWVQSADGAYWVPLPDQSGGISVLVAGAIADGDAFDSTVGTDNYQFIQNLIDAHTYYAICSYVAFPILGLFRITNCIQCGYGDDNFPFVTTHLRGSGGAQFTGDTVLVCDFSDRPGMNIQGQRFFSMFGITIKGQLAAYIDAHQLGTWNADLDDSDPNNWCDLSLAGAATMYSQTAPYAGIAIDALSGSTPDVPYPSLPVPAFLSVSGDYNRNFSSKIILDQCSIGGFDTGYCVHPNDQPDADGNGDFHDLTNCQIGKCRYGISVGHTQCRQVNRINCEFGGLYCMETTSTHGRQNGKMEGLSSGCAVDTTLNLFLFENDLSIAGPIRYDKLYGELCWKMGFVGNPTAQATSLEFNGCNINFNLQQDADALVPDQLRGVPAGMLETSGTNPINIVFNGGMLSGYWSVMHMYTGDGNNLTINGTLIQPRNFGSKQFRYERAAQNVTAGGLAIMPNPEIKTGTVRINAPLYDLSDPDDVTYFDSIGTPAMIGPTAQNVNRDRPCCALIKSAYGGDGFEENEAPIPKLYDFVDKGSTSGRSLVGRVLTFSYGTDDYTSMRLGPRIGDVIMDIDSGSVFYVSNHSTAAGPTFTITAVLQNNFVTDGVGGFNPKNSIDIDSGTWWCLNSRVYRPGNVLLGDMTSGSANVTGAGTPSGDTGAMTDDIVNGDWYLVTDRAASYPFPAIDNSVSALAAGSFTLGAAANYTEARHNFQFFIRASAAS